MTTLVENLFALKFPLKLSNKTQACKTQILVLLVVSLGQSQQNY